MSALRYLGPNNGYLPQATGVVVSFIRKKGKFKINEYVQQVKSPAPIGTYRYLGVDAAVRVVDPANFVWPDGQDRPSGENFGIPSIIKDFLCQRYDYPYRIGWVAQQTVAPDWKVLASHSDMAVSLAMTCRTKRFITLAETAGTWGNNTATAQTLAGTAGFFDTASSDPADTTNYNFGFRTLTAAGNAIVKATNSMVTWDDLRWVMSPEFARRFAASSEVRDYLAQSRFALAQVRGDVPSQNGHYGLPDRFANIQVVVEDATIVTEYPKVTQDAGSEATANRTFIKPDMTTYLVSRPGGLDGAYGQPSYSTFQQYYFDKEMQIEAFDEPKHRRTEGHVVEYMAEVVPAPISGYLISNCLSS